MKILLDENIDTRLNGFFQIGIPISEKKILFESVGLDPATIELVDKCDEVEVVMMLSSTYDFITLKKADRLRRFGYCSKNSVCLNAYYYCLMLSTVHFVTLRILH